MKDYIKYNIKEVTTKELLNCYDIENVRNYCRSCNKYGKVWSCPDLSINEIEYITNYDYCYVISSKVFINDLTKDFITNLIKNVASKYSDMNISMDNNSEIFSGIYYGLREYNDNIIFGLEKIFPDAITLMSGRCLLCESCERTKNLPCQKPQLLRYSLEALGFNVSKIIENIMQDKIMWSNDCLPEFVTCVSALLSKKKISEQDILTILK